MSFTPKSDPGLAVEGASATESRWLSQLLTEQEFTNRLLIALLRHLDAPVPEHPEAQYQRERAEKRAGGRR